nr:FkbM family methyltransferase [Halochromatium salexigens]
MPQASDSGSQASQRPGKRARFSQKWQAKKKSKKGTATSLYQQALKAEQRGALETAEAGYRKLLAQHPEHADAAYRLGVVLHQRGDAVQAESMFRCAIASNDQVAAYHGEHGIALAALSRLDEALFAFDQALRLKPNDATAHNNRGIALNDLGYLEDALHAFDQALRLKPDFAEAHNNRGNTLNELRRWDDAVQACDQALHLRPKYAEAHNNRGIALNELGRLGEALQAYEQALRLNPDLAKVHNNRGNTLKGLGRMDDALHAYDQALRLQPEYAKAHSNRGTVLWFLGRLDAALHAYEQALRLKPDSAETISNYLFTLSGLERGDDAAFLARARRYGSRYPRSLPALEHQRAPAAGRRLRVGYVSGDFRQHAVAHFFEPLLSEHDRSRLELWAYTTNEQQDAVTARIQELVDHWQSIVGLSDEAAAALIRSDELDVLVDLSNHTNDNRLGVFAQRAAPVQVEYLGHFSTTGVAEIDYWIGDPQQTPPSTDAHYSETVWRLPRVAHVYRGSEDAPAPGWQPQEDGTVWLGCFHNPIKLTAGTIALWSRLLHALPEAKLRLKAKQLSDTGWREQLTNAFAAHGIGADRLKLHDRSATLDWAAHMGAYDGLDIALDPIGPWRGAATNCDALWMGVPVVTLRGERAGSRQTAALLQALGREDWIADDEDSYIDTVVALARDVERRRAMRFHQRKQMRASPLCDAKGLATALEDAYGAMFQRWWETRGAGASTDKRAAVPRWTLTIADEVKVCVPADIERMTTFVLLEQEDWFEVELPFLRDLTQPGMGVLDIGANHGLYALSLAQCLQGEGRVLACEPANAPADMLERSIVENRFESVLTLLRVGLSDHAGEATLHIGANSELNSLALAGSTSGGPFAAQTETVRLTTLDALLDAPEWPSGFQVDILKLDAEGEEIRILQGGQRFFAEQDPLVLFEWKHGNRPNAGLLEAFAALGYTRYRLVPGLNALVPVGEGETLDGYQLNLFACTPERAMRLAAAGYLVEAATVATEAPAPSQTWPQALAALPYVAALPAEEQTIAAWQAFERTDDPHWPAYERALNAYLSASDARQPVRNRWAWLQQSRAQLEVLHAAGDNHLATEMLRIRVLAASGARAAAVEANAALLPLLETDLSLPFDRPFLPPLPDYDQRAPEDGIGAWLLAAIRESLEVGRAHSAYFHRDERILQRLVDNPNCSLAMHRRRLLLESRAGEQVTLASDSPLCAAKPSPWHRNPAWWRQFQDQREINPASGGKEQHAPRVPLRDVFCAGMPRSGSTWSYNVARQLLSHAFGAQQIDGGYLGEGPPVDAALDQHVLPNKLRLLKFHQATRRTLELAEQGQARVIVTYRDPMNAVASLVDFFATPLPQAVAKIKRSLVEMQRWQQTGHALLIAFDAMMADNATEVRKIADFLDLPVQEEVIAAIVAETSYGAVKQRAEALGQGGEVLVRAGRSAYDPESLLHVGHAPLGADRDWTRQLSSEQKAYALQQLSDWIDADGRWHTDSSFNR